MMNKKVLYTFIALTLIVFLTACGKETKKTADPNAAFNIECIAAKENGTNMLQDMWLLLHKNLMISLYIKNTKKLKRKQLKAIPREIYHMN